MDAAVVISIVFTGANFIVLGVVVCMNHRNYRSLEDKVQHLENRVTGLALQVQDVDGREEDNLPVAVVVSRRRSSRSPR